MYTVWVQLFMEVNKLLYVLISYQKQNDFNIMALILFKNVFT